MQAVEALFKATFARAAAQCKKTEDELRAMPLGGRRNYHDDISIIVLDLKGQTDK